MLLRMFSVFTTVSTMGVVLGVASLVVVLAVTSGFEREFQDKVLAVNAHLIVIAYGRARPRRVASTRRTRSMTKLRDLPGVVRMAKFSFSAGEVMVGRVGANLKGIDMADGRRRAARTLHRRARWTTWPRPPTCAPRGGRHGADAGRMFAGRRAGPPAPGRSWATACRSGPVRRGGRGAAGLVPLQGRGALPDGLQRVRHPPGLRQPGGRPPPGQRPPVGVRRRAALHRSDDGARVAGRGEAPAGPEPTDRRLGGR